MEETLQPVTVQGIVKPLSRTVSINLEFVTVKKGQYMQVFVNGHTVEVAFHNSGRVTVCVDDESIVKHFDEVYGE